MLIILSRTMWCFSSTTVFNARCLPDFTFTFYNLHFLLLVLSLITISSGVPLSNFSTIPNIGLEFGFQLHVLKQFSSTFGTSSTNPPLFTDMHMNGGNIDAIFATMDGIVHAYSFGSDGIRPTNSPGISSVWACPIHGENFASSPVLVSSALFI